MRGLVALALLLTVLAMDAGAEVVRDMLGREVALAGSPRRIVSLVPSITETLYALGGEDRLVGVTTLCDYPPAAREKPKIGGIVNPSLEAIVGLRPDLVLATTEGNREATVRQLGEIGLATYVVRPKSFESVLDSITRIGALAGRAGAARELVEDLRHRAARVAAATRGRPRPAVLYLVWGDPVIVPGRDTLITHLVTMAGGASVSADEPLEWPRWSLEQIVARAPDVVIVATTNRVHVDDALRRWRAQGIALPAFSSGRVHAIDGDLVHRPGPRIVEGLEALARVIHPGTLP